jgi:predicted acyl esterase
MGRKGWFDEVMRFYDRYLQGKTSTVKDPPLAVESSDGKWRSELAWPPKDATLKTASLKSGSYLDDGQNNGSAFGGSTPPFGRGIWTFSPPLKSAAHFAGVPRVTLDVQALTTDANGVVDLYDVDAGGNATLISRGTTLLPDKGPVTFDLYGNDWKLPAGHRVGVLVSSANSEWWTHASTGQQVTVRSAQVALPFLRCARNAAIQGDPSIRLEDYKAGAPFAVDAATIAGATDQKFPLPAALRSC